jgi:hypothetical protein
MHILWKGKQGATPTNWSFDMKRWIEIEDIKAAVDSGRIVYADSKSYQVKKIKEEYYIPNIEGVIKLSELKDVDELKDKKVLGVGTETLIYNDCPCDQFTLHNVIQLNNDIMYKIDEYILRKNLDKYDTIIAHSDTSIKDPNISKNVILYNDIFNDFSDDTNVNELIRLFSGIFRIHIKPNNIVQHFSKRYWHPWDEEFTVL